MKRFLLLLAAVLTALFAQAQPIPADPAFRTGRLDNGLTYYLAHNENPKGCAEFFIAHHVGALQEEDSQDGLAHFLEHMAFNGTKHYPGKSLLEFLAKDGVRFGYNVNAYTTRTETVYNISAVPLVRESFVDSVLLALHDWSCDISCEPRALDEERGVIMEEYRLRDDARSRVARLQNNIIYKGSKHTRRSVIGSLDVIQNFKREEILDFYHKWYRPDQQAIFIVGDFDVDAMEAKVRKAFADIPMPANAPQKEVYKAPHLDEPLFEDMADDRLKFFAVKIFCKQPYPTAEQLSTEEYLRDWYCRNIVSNVLAERLKKGIQAKDSPVRAAVLTTNEYTPDYFLSLFTVTPKEKELMGESLAFTWREIRRILKYGVSREEVEAARLATAQRYHLDRPVAREDVKNGDIVRGALEHFLWNRPLVHPADLQEIESRILNDIRYEELAPYPAKMFRDCELIFTNCYNPVEDPGIAPSADKMKEILAQVDAEEIGPQFLEYKAPDLNVDAPKGHITKVSRKKGYELWTLSNGAKVYYKKLDSLNSNFHLAMNWRWESGAKSYDQQKVTASRFASAYLSHNLGFRGMTKQECKNYPELSGYTWNLSVLRGKAYMLSMAGKGKEENAFKTIYLTLNEPCFGNQLEQMKSNKLKSLSKKKTPRGLFDERLLREEYGNHPWLQEIDSAAVQATDMALVEDVFHRALGNPKALSVFICTDLDRAEVEDYVCRYVASLGGDYPYKMAKTEAPTLRVKGRMVIEDEQPKEGEPLTSIYHAWLRKEKDNTRNLIISDFLDYILSARYLNLIREERGGAYHVGYSTVVPEEKGKPWMGVVKFQTRPELKDVLLKDVEDVMAQMCKEGPTAEEMDVAAKYILKRHGELDARAKRNIGTQLDRLMETVLQGRDYDCDYAKIVSGITAADVQKMARRFAAGDLLQEIYTEK